MRHIKPFMESVGHPREYTYDQMKALQRGQVMDEITSGEADVVAKAIAAAGLQGAMVQYDTISFKEYGNLVNKAYRIRNGKITFEKVVGPTSLPFHNLYFLKFNLSTDYLSIFKTTDDWWWVEIDDSCHLCDGINEVVDLIRTLKSE